MSLSRLRFSSLTFSSTLTPRPTELRRAVQNWQGGHPARCKRPSRIPAMAAAPLSRAQASLDSHGSQGARVVAAAAERNKDAILGVLKSRLLAPQGMVLEVASGTGQHCAHFAAAMPHLTWQPTEYSSDCFSSIEAWGEGLPNMLRPATLDAAQPDTWPAAPGSCVGVLCANMCHISPLVCTLGLLRGAARALAPGGVLLIYGPFLVDGKPTTESNAAFDASLRARNSEWGYRDVGDIASWAAAEGLEFFERVAMPANNFTLVLRKPAAAGAER